MTGLQFPDFFCILSSMGKRRHTFVASSKNKTTNSVKGKTAAGKTSGRKPGRPRKNPVPVQEEPAGFLREGDAYASLSFAAAVLLFLSNFPPVRRGRCVFAWSTAWIIWNGGIYCSAYFVCGNLLCLSNRGNRAAAGKLAAAVTWLFFFSAGFASAFFRTGSGRGQIHTGLLHHTSARSGFGGGLAGGSFAQF